MGSQVLSSIENNFTKGLVTEFTGLNFPENAATDCDNCEFTIVGDVLRRTGIDLEENFDIWSLQRSGSAVNTYKWNNAGGDGNTQLLVVQVQGVLNFWVSSAATVASPLSNQILISTVTLSNFTALSGSFDTTLECQFSDGNGYLFVTHPSCDPIYCTYASNTVTGNRITVQIRDFTGVTEAGQPVNSRPTTITPQHNYNLLNQGWTAGNPWQASDTTTSILIGLGLKTFIVAAGLPVTLGDSVTVIYNGSPPILGIPVGTPLMSGNVTVYAGTSMTVNVTSGSTGWFGTTVAGFLLSPRNTAYLSTWNSAVGSYPSNSDVWWYFKNASGVFDPATTLQNVSLGIGNAPRGHFILDAFNQQRDVISNLPMDDIITTVRPKTTTWFQGRVWYAGADAQQASTATSNFYTWTESIYFSQIVQNPSSFGYCFQTNDPTSETLFDLLPTDGGVIQIQGCGSIYKLFPIQNGMLVFAANGIWFITGSQGIGFSANDYTITKLSSVQSISGTSFINVQGLPYFWNEEGIYAVQPAKGGGLEVEPLTVGTILSFYSQIPVSSKKYVRGDYNPIDYVIQWLYKSDEATSVTERYQFDKILNYSTYNKAFFPYTIPSSNLSVNGINYVASPGGSNAPLPIFKYLSTRISPSGLTWSDMRDTNYTDFASYNGGTNYTSYFVTGYKLHGQGQRRFQIPYIYVFSRADDPTSYKIQGLWDYAISGNSGRWSVAQLVENWFPNFAMIFRRHKIRGRGLILQIKITSADGQPFDIMGWSTFETQNTGV